MAGDTCPRQLPAGKDRAAVILLHMHLSISEFCTLVRCGQWPQHTRGRSTFYLLQRGLAFLEPSTLRSGDLQANNCLIQSEGDCKGADLQQGTVAATHSQKHLPMPTPPHDLSPGLGRDLKHLHRRDPVHTHSSAILIHWHGERRRPLSFPLPAAPVPGERSAG